MSGSVWPRGQVLDAGGVALRYHAAGHGPAVVLIHGLLGHSFSWRKNIPALAEGFRVYALDLPGLGESEAPPHFRHSLEETAAVVAAFIRAMGHERAALIGHSYGGSAAMVCAARQPALISALVLIAPANPFSTNGRLRIRLGATWVGECILQAARLHPYRLAELLLRYRLYGDSGCPVEPETVTGYAQPLLQPGTAAVLRKTLAAWDMPALAKCIQAVRQPALVMCGDRDRIVPLASTATLARALGALV